MVLIKTGIVIARDRVRPALCATCAISRPSFRPITGEFGKFGISGILAASGMIFFAYIGFEAVSVAAQEAKNPRRDLPIGILGSLAICTVLYMLMALVLTGITDWRTLDVANPVSFAIGKDRRARAGWCCPIDVGALVGLASVVFVSLYGQSRVFYSMARDGFSAAAFSAVHARFRTPIAAPSSRAFSPRLLAASFRSIFWPISSPSERCSPSSRSASAS